MDYNLRLSARYIEGFPNAANLKQAVETSIANVHSSDNPLGRTWFYVGCLVALAFALNMRAGDVHLFGSSAREI
jgi:hypothetical protein